MTLRDSLLKLEQAINARDLRERRLIAVVCVVVLTAVWYAAMQAPVLKHITAATEQADDIQKKIRIEQSTAEQLQQTLNSNPTLIKKNRLQQARIEIERLEARLAERALKVITPTQMVQALRDLLEQQQGLHLISLRNLAVEPAFKAGTTAADNGTGNNAPVVYRHRVRIAMRGDYLSALRYLDALEALPWQFQWDELSIEMDEYPAANIVLYVNTLSLGVNWIGT